MLIFEDEIIEFKLKGKEYSMEKPNNGQIAEYTYKLKACKDNESKEKALIVFLESLGLKEETYKLLKPKQLEVLLEKLYESEKN